MRTGSACPITPEQREERGFAWILGSFLLCPCHLPITLWIVGALLSGTAAGAALKGHVLFAGAMISVLWLAGTLWGLNLIRRARVEARENGPRLRLFDPSE